MASREVRVHLEVDSEELQAAIRRAVRAELAAREPKPPPWWVVPLGMAAGGAMATAALGQQWGWW